MFFSLLLVNACFSCNVVFWSYSFICLFYCPLISRVVIIMTYSAAGEGVAIVPKSYSSFLYYINITSSYGNYDYLTKYEQYIHTHAATIKC